MALDGLRKVIKRIEEIRRNFNELSRFQQRVKGGNESSFRELYVKEIDKREALDRGKVEEVEVESRTSSAYKEPRKAAPYIKDIVNRASRAYGVDPDLVMAVMKVESNFNPHTISPKGAIGLMQLMPDTAQEMGVSDPFDVEENVMGGVKYLRYLSEKYKGNLELVLAAYNAGPGAVDRYGGIPPYKETQDYVKRVLSIYKKLKE